MQRASVGSVEIVALVDNVQAYPGPAVYTDAGDALGQYRHYMDANGAVVLNFGCFLLRDGATTVLVDTGWGPEMQGKLPGELAAAGVATSEVNQVIFTHLHGDHTGWNIDRASGKPLFANAKYLVPGADWAHYSKQTPPPDSFTRDVVPLQAAGSMELFDGEKTLSPSLTAVPTPGHTPGHTSIAISSGGAKGFILGDVVLSPIDTEEPAFKNSFDWDHEIARATRLRILERLTGDGSLVGGSHLPPPGVGRFVKDGAKARWQPAQS
jgi:glyoxylase-like metal-dependent hydrolase (beta-lactamase superfamily II)